METAAAVAHTPQRRSRHGGEAHLGHGLIRQAIATARRVQTVVKLASFAAGEQATLRAALGAEANGCRLR